MTLSVEWRKRYYRLFERVDDKKLYKEIFKSKDAELVHYRRTLLNNETK